MKRIPDVVLGRIEGVCFALAGAMIHYMIEDGVDSFTLIAFLTFFSVGFFFIQKEAK